MLFQQTREAQTANIDFQGVYDLRRALDAAAAGQGLHPLVLGAVATTLAATQRLREAVDAGGDATAGLQILAEGLGDGLPELQQRIERCVNVSVQCVVEYHVAPPCCLFLSLS